MPLVKRTRAIFLSAEFGFLGVVVETLVQTPRLKGAGKNTGLFFKTLNPLARATVLCLEWTLTLFFLINWLIVGIKFAKKTIEKQNSPHGTMRVIYYEKIGRASCRERV